MKAGQILFMVILVAAGFFAGQAWQQRADSAATREDTDSVVTKQDTTMTPVEVILDNAEATIRLFERSAPSVAFITSIDVQRDYWTRNILEIPQGSGSGFVWDLEGHIVTNYHVIKDGRHALVTLADQTTWQGEII